MDEPRYILGQKIARGGMAEIFLGKHVGEDAFQRICVIKRILPHYSDNDEFVQMFRDEAHICKRLQHANIVRVEGFEEVEGSYAIIMEFVDGADLRSLLHACENMKTRLLVPMACYIIAETARGLHYAHTKVDDITNRPLGIVHRDISPQNILVSYEGEVKVTDFGIADAESKITETRPGVVKGKYSYMSPEQISAKQVDARTDVFALSIVLWEMLHMERMFHGQNEVETIQMVKACKIKAPKNPNPDVDDQLNSILMRGLAKDPKKRLNSAAELEKELRIYLNKVYPEFTSLDLGEFLKKVLDKKRKESAANIKRTLTETNLKVAGKRPGRKRSIDLEFDEGSALNFSIAASPSQVNSSNLPVQRKSQVSKVNTRTSTQFKPNYNATSATRIGNRGGWGHKSKSSFSKYAIYLTALALAASLSLIIFTKLKAQNVPPVLVLRTSPARVKVSLDKRALNKGRYLTATTQNPIKLTLTPGKHRLKVTREGYRPYTFIFNAEKGQVITKTDIILKDRLRPARVMIEMDPATQPIKIDINNGFYQATLKPKQKTMVTPDLHYKRNYSMRVYPDINSRKNSFVCKFKATALDWKMRNVVTINPQRKSCKVK